MKKYLTNKWVVISVAIFCAILWGSAFPVLKIGYAEMQMQSDDTSAKVVFAGLRFLLAGLILLIFLAITNRKALKVTKRQLPVLLLFGFVQTALQYYFFYNGLARTSGMQAAILISSGTFFTVLLAHFFYANDRMNWRIIVGLCAGFIGVIVANWGTSFQFHFQLTGEGFMILAALTGAVGTIMAKEMALGIHPFALTGWQLTLGSLMMLVYGLPQLEQGAMVFNTLGTILFVYSAVLSAVAFALWYSLLKYNKAGELSIYKFATPVSGAILSVFIIPGETFTVFIVAALVFVSIGFVAINYKPKKRLRLTKGSKHA